MNYSNSLPSAFYHPTLICPASHPLWGSAPLPLGSSSSELFTYNKTSRITLIKKKVSLNPTEAWVLKRFIHAIEQYCGFNISLANRKKKSKNATTNCTFESKNSNSVRNPGNSLLRSPPLYQGPESKATISPKPKAGWWLGSKPNVLPLVQNFSTKAFWDHPFPFSRRQNKS